MIYRIVKGNKVTYTTASSDSKFPKVVVVSPTSMEVAANAVEFSEIDADEGAITFEVSETPVVVVSDTSYDLEIGVDYDTCVLTTYADGPLVIKKIINPPVLALDINMEGNPELEWSSAFGVKTRIYRTDVYEFGDPTPNDYTLIAEINGTAIPGESGTYTDITIELLGDEEPAISVSYFVVNDNGVSNVEQLSSDEEEFSAM